MSLDGQRKTLISFQKQKSLGGQWIGEGKAEKRVACQNKNEFRGYGILCEGGKHAFEDRGIPVY